MKRRSFLLSFLILPVQAFGQKVVWAVKGKLGYVEKAPGKKSCETCKFLYRDETINGAGLCRQPAIMAAAKAEDVHVKKTGYCKMWQGDG